MELQTDVSLRVDLTDSPDKWTVSGRELHLSILIETMCQKDTWASSISSRSYIKEIDGVHREPFYVQIDTPEEYQGSVIQSLSERKWWNVGYGLQQVTVTVWNSSLFQRVGYWYSTEFLSMTRGYGNHEPHLDQYLPVIPGEIGGSPYALVSIDNGKQPLDLLSIEERYDL